MVSTPEVVIRFVGKGELRRLGARVRRIYGDFRSRLKREERAERGREVEGAAVKTMEAGGDDPERAVEVEVKKRPRRRPGRKTRPAADHPWRRSYKK